MSYSLALKEQQLLALLKERSFQLGEFLLSSGQTSDYYLDVRMTSLCSSGAALIGDVIYERCWDLELDALGGLESGAIPLVTATILSYHRVGQFIEGFWVREETKDHGTQKRIEGHLSKGFRVVIIDDVITTGASMLKAIAAVRDQECEVVQVIALVDRLQGAEQLLWNHGIANYQSVFTIEDFGIVKA